MTNEINKEYGQSSNLLDLVSEIQNDKITYLEERIKLLGDICQNLNPYEDISNEMKMKLMDFHILDFSDPFKITNSLLMLLEDSIDELHLLKPYVNSYDKSHNDNF